MSTSTKTRQKSSQSRIPEKSTLYERVLPGMLLFLTIVMVSLILFAIGVLVGLVPY